MFILNRDMSTFLKGIAIILMVVHHSLGYPEWYISDRYIYFYDKTYIIQNLANFLVVPMFAFLTGWSYFYHKDKSYKYSKIKIYKFLLSYWIIYIPFLFLAIYFCGYRPNCFDIVLEAFGLSKNIMIFNWYICFYVTIMFILPIYNKIFKKNNSLIKEIIIMILIIVTMILIDVFFDFKVLNKYLEVIYKYLPCSISGYLCAKYGILSCLYERLSRYNKIYSLIIIFITIIMSTIKPYIYICLGCLYVPIFLVAAFHINIYKNKYINRSISFLAKQSMNIWFLHCIFFAVVTRNVFQPIAFIWENPVITVVWILFICSILSLIIGKIQKLINKYIDKCFIGI